MIHKLSTFFPHHPLGSIGKWRPIKIGILIPPTLLEIKFSYKNVSTPHKFLTVGHHKRMLPLHMKEINAKIVLLDFLSCNTTQHLIFQLRFRTYVCLCIMSLLFLSHQEMLRNFSFSQNKIQHRKKFLILLDVCLLLLCDWQSDLLKFMLGKKLIKSHTYDSFLFCVDWLRLNKFLVIYLFILIEWEYKIVNDFVVYSSKILRKRKNYRNSIII